MIFSSMRRFALVAAALQTVQGLKLDIDDTASVRSTTSTIAHELMSYYKGNVSGGATVGILPMPYYWWEAGAMWGGMLDYFHLTKDDTYNKQISEALLSQIGPAKDYVVPAQQFDEGNDDQAFWGFSVMSAAEQNYTPPPRGTPSWLQLVTNLWNTQVPRWDTTKCGGGLKWQIYKSNAGYDYKNSVSNGAFFQLAARLARYTGNHTYVEWADKAWDWTRAVGLIDDDYNVYDGTDDLTNCTSLDHTQYSYNTAVYLYGAAVMYNYTNGSSIWEERTTGLLNASAYFFSPFKNSSNVMFERSCETKSSCNTDAQSFKAYLSRFMWATTVVAPFTRSAISTQLRTSARGAAAACAGGKARTTCGSRWYTNGWDNLFGVGQQLSALEVIQGLLIEDAPPPRTGPNVHLGTTPASASTVPVPEPISTATPAPADPTTSKSAGTHGKRLAAGGLFGAGLALGMAGNA
ncbi:MAG: hypothetical protein M4579_004721 [Chaenotheca gracillima]|nr:MAG: hypothetical protein M4579_004721 [Chaenotheca gracillima]